MPKQSIPIELGGKTRHLRYDFNALERVNDELGVHPLDLPAVLDISTIDIQKGQKAKSEMELADLAKKINFKRLKKLAWIGLLHEDESLTEKEVGGWLDLGNFRVVLEAIVEAYVHVDDEEEAKNETSPGVKKNPTEVIPGKNIKEKPTN